MTQLCDIPSYRQTALWSFSRQIPLLSYVFSVATDVGVWDKAFCACSTGNPGANEGKSRTVCSFQLSTHVELNEFEVGFQNSQPLQPPMPGNLSAVPEKNFKKHLPVTSLLQPRAVIQQWTGLECFVGLCWLMNILTLLIPFDLIHIEMMRRDYIILLYSL